MLQHASHMLRKPDEIMDRDEDWGILSKFCHTYHENLPPGANIAVVTGRRRTGKTFLLDRFSEAIGGLYFEAREDETRFVAQARLRNAIAEYEPRRAAEIMAIPAGEKDSWERILEAAMDVTWARRGLGTRIPPVIIDEFPYLLRHTPELQSILHQLYDTSHFRRGEVRPLYASKGYFRRLVEGNLLLCGSAMSVMHELGHGSRPLFGRLTWTLTIDPFDHVDIARFWGIEDPRVAFALYAVLGGAAGYRNPLVRATDLPVPQTMAELDAWIADTLLRPRPDFFTDTEIDHLLREDPRIKDKDVFRQVMRAIAEGATTKAKVAAAIGRPQDEADQVLARLESMRYVEARSDLLHSRGSTARLTDPIVRFHHAVVEPRMTALQEEETTPAEAWADAQQSFRSQVIGPAFEELAFRTSFRLLRRRGVDISQHGWTRVNDPVARKAYEVDLVGLAYGTRSPRVSKITVIGETKATQRQRGLKDLERLRHIRALLAKDHDAENAKLAVFSLYGFSEHLKQAAKEAPDEILLFDLDDIYSWKSSKGTAESAESALIAG